MQELIAQVKVVYDVINVMARRLKGQRVQHHFRGDMSKSWPEARGRVLAKRQVQYDGDLDIEIDEDDLKLDGPLLDKLRD